MLQNHQQQILYSSHCLLTPPIPFSPSSTQPNTLYSTCMWAPHPFFLAEMEFFTTMQKSIALFHHLNRTSVVFFIQFAIAPLFYFSVFVLSRGSLHTSHLSYLTYTLMRIPWLCIKKQKTKKQQHYSNFVLQYM